MLHFFTCYCTFCNVTGTCCSVNLLHVVQVPYCSSTCTCKFTTCTCSARVEKLDYYSLQTPHQTPPPRGGGLVWSEGLGSDLSSSDLVNLVNGCPLLINMRKKCQKKCTKKILKSTWKKKFSSIFSKIFSKSAHGSNRRVVSASSLNRQARPWRGR